jgi:hypothetical protein
VTPLALPKARPVVIWMGYECPKCHDMLRVNCDDLEEDDAGRLAPEGPDRYPLCPMCETQFECQPVRIVLDEDTAR